MPQNPHPSEQREKTPDVEGKLDDLRRREEERALERFTASLKMPKTVGAYKETEIQGEFLQQADRDLKRLLSIDASTSLFTALKAGRQERFSGSGVLRSSFRTTFGREGVSIEGTWRQDVGGTSVSTLRFMGGEPVLRLGFDRNGNLATLAQNRDPFNAWGQLATQRDLPLAGALQPGSQSIREYYLARWRSEREKENQPSVAKVPMESIRKVGVVPTGQVRVETMGVPLATSHLWICAGLSVINRAQGKHLLAHVNGGTGDGGDGADAECLARLRGALKDINVKDSEITIVIGDEEENIPRQLFRILTEDYGVESGRIRIIPPREINERGGGSRGEDCIIAPNAKKVVFRALPLHRDEDTERTKYFVERMFPRD